MSKIITRKALSKLIAKRANFFEYEAMEFLHALEYVMKNEFAAGNSIRIPDVCTISPVVTEGVHYHNPVTRVHEVAGVKAKLKCKISDKMKRMLEGNDSEDSDV